MTKSNRINVLAMCFSPRKGNSLYLMEQALAPLSELPLDLDINTFHIQGKKIEPCISCLKCYENQGRCIFKDDFEEARQLWIKADVVLYSFPVYHVSIPAQMKAFFDRLGNTFYGYYEINSTRHMKAIGAMVNGAHFFAGQELCISQIMHHAALMNSLYVSGDGWHSYTGAPAWTNKQASTDALRNLMEAGDPDTAISITAAQSVAKRCVQVAAMIKLGMRELAPILQDDIRYKYSLGRAMIEE